MDATVLQNKMDYHSDCFRLGILVRTRQVDEVGLAHVMVPQNMMNYHLDCFRFARKGIHRMSQVDAL